MLNNKKSCSGRSMVELIAVFAVLSALILGGVLGFLYFRDKNTANNVLKEALVQASEIKIRSKQYTYVDESGKEQIKYPRADKSQFINYRAYADEGSTLILKAFNVSEGVCSKLVSEGQVSIFTISTDDENNKTVCAEGNNNTVVFMTDTKTLPEGEFDPCNFVTCNNGTCYAGICICNPGYGGDDCAKNLCEGIKPLLHCNVDDAFNTNGCKVVEKLECGSLDCNKAFGDCCQEGEAYYSEIKDCCLKTQWASVETKCCLENEYPTLEGYCCPTEKKWFGEKAKCCTDEKYASLTDECCSDDQDVVNGVCCAKGNYAEVEGVCCPAEKHETNGYCCPKNELWLKGLGCTSCGDGYLYCAEYDKDGICARHACCENELSNGYCCPKGKVYDQNRRECVTCVLGSNEGCNGGICLCKSYSDGAAGVNDKCCLHCSGETYCIEKKPLSQIKNIQGRYNLMPFYISEEIMPYFNAEYYCRAYGMHMPSIQEACAKDYSGDSGHACPNLQGQFAEYGVTEGQTGGDIWLGETPTDGNCWALQVTNSCGNNHFATTCVNRHAVCTFGTNTACTLSSTNKDCVTCSDINIDLYQTTKQDCATCSTGSRFFREDGYCLKCSNADSHSNVTKEECGRCSNRYWLPTDAANSIGLCKTCPGQSLVNSDGTGCDCGSGKVMRTDNSTCIACLKGNDAYYTDKMECLKCAHTMWRSSDKVCISCNHSSDLTGLTKEECLGCSNRYWDNGVCRICPNGGKTSADGLSCDNCATNEFFASNKTCYSCEQNSGFAIGSSASTCQSCGKDTFFWRDSDKLCIDCENPYNQGSVTKAECGRCSNRYWYVTDAAKGLGECRPCPAGTSVNFDGTACACPEGQLTRTDNNTCVACPVGNTAYYSRQEQCFDCDNTMWRSSDKLCFNCDYSTDLTGLTQEECFRCSNRYWDNDGVCRICPNGGKRASDGLSCDNCASNEFFASNKTCYSCEQNSGFTIGSSASACQSCGDDTFFWRDSDKSCIDCENPYNQGSVTKAECGRCSNRYWYVTDAAKGLGECRLCQAGVGVNASGTACGCPEGQLTRTDNNTCVACPIANTSYYSEQEQCLACTNTMWRSGDKVCFNCDYSNDLTGLTKEECLGCSNRYWDNGVCRICPNGGKTSVDGLSCDNCATNEFFASNKTCYSCEQNSGFAIESSASACQSCGDDTFFWRDSDKSCIDCENPYNQGNVTKEECGRCSNRYWYVKDATKGLGECRLCPAGTSVNFDGTACACPEGQLMRTDNNTCVACPIANTSYYSEQEQCFDCDNTMWRSSDKVCFNCDYSTDLTGLTQEECFRCSNRYWDNDGVCRICPNGGKRASDGLSCDNCASNEFFASNKTCYSCKQGSGFYVGSVKTTCQSCGKDTFFWRDSDKLCFDCENPYNQGNVTKEECGRCSNRYWYVTDAAKGLGECRPCPAGVKAKSDGLSCDCPKGQLTYTGNNSCLACPTGNGIVYSEKNACLSCDHTNWRVYDRLCISCDYSAHYNDGITKDECLTCPNRYWKATNAGNLVEGAFLCRICPNGLNATPDGEGCICSEGEFWSYEEEKCFSCFDNKDRYGIKEEDCLVCGKNRTWSSSLFLGKCSRAQSCEIGQYLDNKFICVDCPAGHYCPLREKEACPVGTYNPNVGGQTIRDCKSCPAGTYADVTGSVSCKAISSGYKGVDADGYCTDIGAVAQSKTCK